MNKFVKFLVLTVVAVLTVTTVVSCKDEDPLGGELAGTWKAVKADGIDVDPQYPVYLQFRTNGVVYEIEKNDTLEGANVVKMTYSRIGTEIFVTTETGTELELWVDKLTSKELIFRGKGGLSRELVRVPDSEVSKFMKFVD